jgi:DNA-binding response OmpR family regulator
MKRALVIDDELDICLMVSRHLQNLNFLTSYAHTVEGARHHAHILDCDLIIIDINLPDGSGLEVMNYVKAYTLDPKIIIISAYDSESQKALQMGASLFITKPFAIKKINEALKTLNFLQYDLQTGSLNP